MACWGTCDEGRLDQFWSLLQPGPGISSSTMRGRPERADGEGSDWQAPFPLPAPSRNTLGTPCGPQEASPCPDPHCCSPLGPLSSGECGTAWLGAKDRVEPLARVGGRVELPSPTAHPTPTSSATAAQGARPARDFRVHFSPGQLAPASRLLFGSACWGQTPGRAWTERRGRPQWHTAFPAFLTAQPQSPPRGEESDC